MDVVGRRTLSAEELAGDVELLAADDDDLLAVQQLLGDSGRQTAEKVALAIDDNLLRSSVYRVPKSPILHFPPLRLATRRCFVGVVGSGGAMRTTGSKVDMFAVVSIRSEMCRRALMSCGLCPVLASGGVRRGAGPAPIRKSCGLAKRAVRGRFAEKFGVEALALVSSPMAMI